MILSEKDYNRFISKISPCHGSDCLEFSDICKSHGYGQIRIENETYLSHRLMLMIIGKDIEVLGRPLKTEDTVMHMCDNTKCCNPHHLKIGTQKENMQDMHAKGRWNAPDNERFDFADKRVI